MSRNQTLAADADPVVSLPHRLRDRPVVLVGMMGSGKTSIGRRVAARLGLPFRDTDAEIEQAAGSTVAELFSRFGEHEFREGERRVIRRLLADDPCVIATGGGAFMDPATRAAVHGRATSVWLRCTLPVLLRRVVGRGHRPLLADGDPATILAELMARRHPIYAEADLAIDCGDEPADYTTRLVLDGLLAFTPPRRLTVPLSGRAYDLVIGGGLLARAGGLLGPVLDQRRAVVVTDANVAGLHLAALRGGLEDAGFEVSAITVAPGEASKSLEAFGSVVDQLLAARVERRTAVVALGGGVIGDLAGFAAAAALRGLPFVQVPTTLLAQVDSSVGGKTGINTAHGKNLVGAFHQPRAVLIDTDTLSTLPLRELRAGYAEIVKAGLIGDAAFYDWCEAHAAAVVAGDRDAQSEAIYRACAFKAAVVADDEREERGSDGRALLNLGHTFAHAIEADLGYGTVLHGEAVAVGLGLAFRLSARLGLCAEAVADRVVAHVASVGLPAELAMLNRRFSASRLVGLMARDKKMRDGRLHFVLARGIGRAFTASDVPAEAVLATLRDAGCAS